MQITTGAKRLGWMEDDLTEDELTNKQVLVIWVITLIATASVVSGLSVGIKLLSQIGFGLGMVLLFLVLVMEVIYHWLCVDQETKLGRFLTFLFCFQKTNYLFNLIVQTTGYCKSSVFSLESF